MKMLLFVVTFLLSSALVQAQVLTNFLIATGVKDMGYMAHISNDYYTVTMILRPTT